MTRHHHTPPASRCSRGEIGADDDNDRWTITTATMTTNGHQRQGYDNSTTTPPVSHCSRGEMKVLMTTTVTTAPTDNNTTAVGDNANDTPTSISRVHSKRRIAWVIFFSLFFCVLMGDHILWGGSIMFLVLTVAPSTAASLCSQGVNVVLKIRIHVFNNCRNINMY
jgi:hypothetical protein